jgi:F0F1-type ATP synthase delta subunit
MSRYTPKQYASALFESLQEKGLPAGRQGAKADVVVKGFVKMLVGNYDRALLPKILMQFKKLERTKAGRHEVVLTSARPLEKSVIADVKKKVGENSGITEVVDPQVLGGVRILINDEIIIDGTMKSRINKMVEQLVKVVG